MDLFHSLDWFHMRAGAGDGKERIGPPLRLDKEMGTRAEHNFHAPCTRSSAQAFCRFAFLLLLLVTPFARATHSTNAPAARGVGVTYAHDDVAEVPWSIHIVKVDRSRGNLKLETTLGAGHHLGMSVVSDQVKALPPEAGRPIAAINGDFFTNSSEYPGDPEGLQITHGELVSAPNGARSCFWVDVAGEPHITNVQSQLTATLPGGKAVSFNLNEERSDGEIVLYTSANGTSTRTSHGVELILGRGAATNWLPLAAGQTYVATVQQVRKEGDSPVAQDTMVLSASPGVAAQFAGVKAGDTVSISTATLPNIAGATTGIGGGPALVHGRKVGSFGRLQLRHPRTALGWNKDYFFLVEVDGRQKISAGMTFAELATYMLNIGCDEAINLDGGGSATMWVYGNVMNSPSEGHERPAANALVVVRKDPLQK